MVFRRRAWGEPWLARHWRWTETAEKQYFALRPFAFLVRWDRIVMVAGEFYGIYRPVFCTSSDFYLALLSSRWRSRGPKFMVWTAGYYYGADLFILEHIPTIQRFDGMQTMEFRILPAVRLARFPFRRSHSDQTKIQLLLRLAGRETRLKGCWLLVLWVGVVRALPENALLRQSRWRPDEHWRFQATSLRKPPLLKACSRTVNGSGAEGWMRRDWLTHVLQENSWPITSHPVTRTAPIRFHGNLASSECPFSH